MLVELNTANLLSIVRNSTPSKIAMESEYLKQYGTSYVTNKGKVWSWNLSLLDLTDEELYDIFHFCQESKNVLV